MRRTSEAHILSVEYYNINDYKTLINRGAKVWHFDITDQIMVYIHLIRRVVIVARSGGPFLLTTSAKSGRSSWLYGRDDGT